MKCQKENHVASLAMPAQPLAHREHLPLRACRAAVWINAFDSVLKYPAAYYMCYESA
jgi:hypothetical protein